MMLAKHPDFFEKSLEEREYLFKTFIQQPAKAKAEETLKRGGADDQLLSLMREISGQGQKNVQNVLNKLGMPSLSDVVKEEGAKEKLQMILYYLKNYEELEFQR